jgi:hypothetical protein
MRKDMMTVVTEPARGGSSYRHTKGEKKRLQLEGDDGVQHEGMGRRWSRTDRRSSRDHLQALRRFLHKQVGRRWDEVYSEICEHAPSGSFLGYHLRELISWEVSVSVTADGGELRGRHGWKVYNGDLYVCPETNLLKVYDDGSQRKRYRWREKSEYEMLAVDEDHKYVKVDGLWYFITLTSIPGAEVTERPFDLVLKEPVFAVDPKAHRYQNRLLRIWGGPVYASAKRQANSREVSRITAALEGGQKVFAKPAREHREVHCGRRQSTTARR